MEQGSSPYRDLTQEMPPGEPSPVLPLQRVVQFDLRSAPKFLVLITLVKPDTVD
jgi:hypothetical protein